MKTLQRHGLANRYYSITEQAKGWFALLLRRFLPAHARLRQIGTGYRDARLLYLAAKLGIADEIANQAVSIEMLSKRLTVNTEALYRLLRSLASLGIFNEVKPNVFTNTHLSLLLRRDTKNSVLHKVLADNNIEKSAVWLDKLELNFNGHITHHSLAVTDAVLDSQIGSVHKSDRLTSTDNPFCDFDWSSFDFVFDFGNSKGEHLSNILQCTNELNVCFYDKPAEIRNARKRWFQGQELTSVIRVSFEEGDILHSIPKASTNKRLYCFVSVSRELNDEDGLLVLSNVRKAIGAFQTTVVIFDSVLPETKADRLMTLSDMQLLVEKSGKERTLSQWKILFLRSDFKLIEMVSLRSVNSVLVLTLK